MKKLFKIFNAVSIINTIIYLLFMYNSSRIKVKELIVIIFNEEVALRISEIYRQIIQYCKLEIYIFLLCFSIYFIISFGIKNIYQKRYLKSKQLKKLKDSKTKKVYKEIYEYLICKEKRAFLLTGDWGSGKTYTIDTFFNNYYKYQDSKVYKISCFGLESRESILKEMKNIFETEDNSITKKILNLINKIPIVGDFLAGILKSDYEIKNVPKNSIFIFDDFERIAPLGEINERINKRNNRREFTKLQMKNRRMYNIHDDNEKNVEYNVLTKYNVVIGIINELVDRYNMKVIILCNTNEINKTFVHEMFECKLDCKKFNISSNSDIFLDLSTRIMNNNVNIPLEKNKDISDFFYKISKDINKIWNNTRIENIRILSGIIAAFLELAKDDIEEITYEDIFYSIYLYHILYYVQNLDFLRELKTGQNIYCYYQKLKKANIMQEKSILNLIEDINNKTVKWIGIEMASKWLTGGNIDYKLNLQDIKNCDNGLEDYIVLNKDIPDLNEYRFDDLMYILSCDIEKVEQIKNIISNHKINFEYRNYKRRDIINNSETFDKIRPMYEYFNGDIKVLEKNDFMDVLFEKLYEIYKIETIPNKSMLWDEFEKKFYELYEMWVKNKTKI